eukprot:3156248-Amphidinium_carterae.1
MAMDAEVPLAHPLGALVTVIMQPQPQIESWSREVQCVNTQNSPVGSIKKQVSINPLSLKPGDLKRINMELRRCAQTTKDVAPELLAIDLKVWELQREHMRLVRIHEEQRAGK